MRLLGYTATDKVITCAPQIKYAMKDRFTRYSRHGRGNIPRVIRRDVYRRDKFTCQFCHCQFSPKDLTIDHLVPLDLGGFDEVTNYITCCQACNQRKSNLPLKVFAASLGDSSG